MFIIDDLKYYFSELHDWIVRKPRPVEWVVARYCRGVRHWNSIYEDTDKYDYVFSKFILNWNIAVRKAKGHTRNVMEDIILAHFFEESTRCAVGDKVRLSREFVTCARYCLTERMVGMSKHIVRGLERIYEATRTEKIMKDCGEEVWLAIQN